MAKLTQCFADNKGNLHTTIDDAVLADLSAALGRVGSDAGIVGGVAKLIIEKRAEIEAAFRDLDSVKQAVAA